MTELDEIDYTDEELDQYAKYFFEEESWRSYLESCDVDPAENPEEDDHDGPLNLQEAIYFTRKTIDDYLHGGDPDSPVYDSLLVELSDLEYRYEQSSNPEEEEMTHAHVQRIITGLQEQVTNLQSQGAKLPGQFLHAVEHLDDLLKGEAVPTFKRQETFTATFVVTQGIDGSFPDKDELMELICETLAESNGGSNEEVWQLDISSLELKDKEG